MTCKLCIPRITPVWVEGINIEYICVEQLDRDDFDEDSFVASKLIKNGQTHPHFVLHGYIGGIKRVWKMYHPIDDWNSEHTLSSTAEVPIFTQAIETVKLI